MLNAILRAFGCYGLDGLKYSVDHLQSIRNKIPFWPRKKQAEYVDAVAKRYTRESPEVTGNMTLNTDPETWFLNPLDNSKLDQVMNTTSIGNIAYTALYHPDENVRKRADLMLENYKKYLSIK